VSKGRALVLVPEDRLDALEDIASLAVELACMTQGRPTCLDGSKEDTAEIILERYEQMHAADGSAGA
jgi:hypothetical protein